MKIEIVHFSLFTIFLQFMRMLTRLIHLKIKTNKKKNHHKQNTPTGGGASQIPLYDQKFWEPIEISSKNLVI